MIDHKRPRRISTREEREARKVIQQAEAEEAMAERERVEKAKYENKERLKAERLAREAAQK